MTIANHELIARSFAAAMNRLDRAALERLVTADFVAEWPQSRERIEGFDNFYSVLAAYPKVDDVRSSNDEQNVGVQVMTMGDIANALPPRRRPGAH